MDCSIRPAGAADLEPLHGVISTTGWGITRESLQAILAWDPGAYLVAEDPAGRALGTVFGLRWRRTGWVGHLVVRPECRGGGVGKALFGQALERLMAAGCRPVYLTATAMGEPLYAKFGFIADGGWSRWGGTAEGVAPAGVAAEGIAPARVAAAGVRVMEAADLDDVVRFDAERFGDDRGTALRWLFAAYPGGGRILRRPDGSLGGYLLRGTEGLGPFVADEEAAPPLFRAALAMLAGQTVSFTFPDANRTAPALCRAAGLKPGRTWLRMRLGDDPAPPRDELLFNASVAKG